MIQSKFGVFFWLYNIAALELLKEAIAKAGYTEEVVIGMDVAASEFYREGKYDLDFKSPDDPNRYITPNELADLYKSFVENYPGNLLTHSFHTLFNSQKQDSVNTNISLIPLTFCIIPLINTNKTITSILMEVIIVVK